MIKHFKSASWYGCSSIILVIKRECQSICLCDIQDIEKLYNINQYANSIVILFSSETPQMYVLSDTESCPVLHKILPNSEGLLYKHIPEHGDVHSRVRV